MRRRIACGLAGALAVSAAGSAPAWSAGTVLELQGKGVQVYGCEAVSGGFAWRLKGPDAVLLDRSGVRVGRHFAGPSWQAMDGSTVVGEVLVASAAPQAGAVPWLLLRAKSHLGPKSPAGLKSPAVQGLFASVGYIARTRTQGGVAPAGGCDRGRLGSESRVPYEATYVLFP